jgi:hypothetical protein
MIIPNIPLIFVWALFSFVVDGYVIDEKYSSSLSLRLVDVETKISPISLLLLNKETNVVVEGLHWSESTSSETSSKDNNKDNNNYLNFTTYLNDQVVDSGTIKLPNDPLELPNSIETGFIVATESGKTVIRVEISDGSTTIVVVETNTRAYQSWIILFPIGCAFIMFLVLNVDMVYALMCSMFIGSWIAEGSFILGSRKIFDTYLLEAISDPTHVSM